MHLTNLSIARAFPTLAAALLTSAAATTQAQTLFGEPRFWGFSYDWSIAAGDFDNDGDIDLFTVDRPSFDSFGQLVDPGEYTINLNTDGLGTFSHTILVDNAGAYTVHAHDLNSDGNLDIIDGDLGVMLGNGDGTFGPITVWENGSPHGPAMNLAFGDMDGDGHADIIVPNAGPVLLNNGDGTFYTNFVSSDVAAGIGVGVGDFNEDGHLDVATVRSSFDVVTVQLGLGDGQGNPGQPYGVPIGAEYPIDLAVVDMNRDGHLDLVTLNGDTDDVSVILGNGDGTFTDPAVYEPHEAAYFEIKRFKVADVTGDGAPEVMITSTVYGDARSQNETTVLRNDGNGVLAIEQTIVEFGKSYENIAAADINGDNSTDLVTASNLLLNQTNSCAPDFNGDGLVDSRDVINFLGAWAAADPAADFNNDGDVNTLDVLAFLSAWSTGC